MLRSAEEAKKVRAVRLAAQGLGRKRSVGSG